MKDNKQEKFNVYEYINYYFNHTYNVVLVWKNIQLLLIENKIINESEFNKINQLIIWHDNSKISKEEFDGYGLKFFSLGDNKNSEESFKQAWKHHKENNLHHHQSLKDYNGPDRKCYLIEMICDWIAMGWETGNLAQDYYETNKDKIELSEEDKKLIEYIFILIKDNNCFSNTKVTEKEKALLYFL